jgi:hypothetical protein
MSGLELAWLSPAPFAGALPWRAAPGASRRIAPAWIRKLLALVLASADSKLAFV